MPGPREHVSFNLKSTCYGASMLHVALVGIKFFSPVFAYSVSGSASVLYVPVRAIQGHSGYAVSGLVDCPEK